MASDHEQMVLQFVEVAGVSKAQARSTLEKEGWNVSKALAKHFDAPPTQPEAKEEKDDKEGKPECPTSTKVLDTMHTVIMKVMGAEDERKEELRMLEESPDEFAFLSSTHPLHCFYKWRLRKVQEEKENAERSPRKAKKRVAEEEEYEYPMELSPKKAKVEGIALEPSTQPAKVVSPAKPPPGTSANPGKIVAYDSIKTKFKSTSAQGPPDGSTWNWFLVGEQRVKPGSGGEATMEIKGSKFQAGWGAAAHLGPDQKTLRQREASMLESIIDGKQNKYGLQRGGVPVGFQHLWSYADEPWKEDMEKYHTTGLVWNEEKDEDRWKVSIQSKLKGDKFEDGVFLLVADQRAVKLNKNQYHTFLRGRKWRVGSLGEDPAVLQERCSKLLREYVEGFKPKVEDSPLGKWLTRKPKA